MIRTAREIVKAVGSRQESASEVIAHSLKRCEDLHRKTNAFRSILTEQATQRALALDQALANGASPGPLCGVPIAIKDNIVHQGHVTSCGSKLLGNYVGTYTATAVKRLEAAGAIVVARTNMDEFGMGSSSENCAWGPVNNPWDLNRVPGGSSGGSAVAVAAGAVPIALGSDTGGSVRQPASFTGIVGLKPTYGRISRFGLVAFASSTDQIGPMTTCSSDAALALEIMAGADPNDATCLTTNYEPWSNNDIQGLRIGRPREYFNGSLEPAIAHAIETCFDRLRANGAEIIDISLAGTELAVACYYIIAPAEASANLARFDGVRYGERVSRTSLTSMIRGSRSSGFGDEVKRRILIGNYVLSAGYYDAYYGRAQQVRNQLRELFKQRFKEVDAIISPTAPTVAYPHKAHSDPIQAYLGDAYTIPASLVGNPAISVPCGVTEGLPIGLQIMVDHQQEHLCFDIAQMLENNNPRGQFASSLLPVS